MVLPIAKPVKGVKMAAKYGDDVLAAGKKSLDDVVRKGKKAACNCPRIDVKALDEELKSLPPNLRVPKIKEIATKVASDRGWTKDGRLGKRNKGRDVYLDPENKLYYSLDTQHGRFEVCNKKGKHLMEVDFNLNQTKPADKTGGHNIIVK